MVRGNLFQAPEVYLLRAWQFQKICWKARQLQGSLADDYLCQADAIVNSVGGRLDLSSGKLSKALSEKAGPKLQESLTKKKGIGEGKMITTAGYNLNCKHIYHCNLPSAMGKQNSIQVNVLLCCQLVVRSFFIKRLHS